MPLLTLPLQLPTPWSLPVPMVWVQASPHAAGLEQAHSCFGKGCCGGERRCGGGGGRGVGVGFGGSYKATPLVIPDDDGNRQQPLGRMRIKSATRRTRGRARQMEACMQA